METKTQTQTPKTQIPEPISKIAYAYTQHDLTITVIEKTCGVNIIRLKQDRTKDPVEDVLAQIAVPYTGGYVPTVLYTVLPVDKAIELKQRAPWLKIRLLQLDGKIVEKVTGRPYDPKAEYPTEVIKIALKVVEIKGGQIRYVHFGEMVDEIISKGFKKVGIFNDVMRDAFKLALQRIGNAGLELVKSCNGDSGCIEINPLGLKSGYRVSFPGTAGRLTQEQMAEMLLRGDARIYYAEIEAQEVPLC